MTLTFSRVVLAGPLLTLAEGKRQLGITDTAHDELVSEKLAEAEELVLAYLGAGGDPTWTPATAPKAVTGVMLAVLTHLYEHRGDDFGVTSRDEAVIWRELSHRLAMYRDPTIA